MDEQERRMTLNRLKEYLNGPLPDDVRADIEATLANEKRMTQKRSLLERIFGKRRT